MNDKEKAALVDVLCDVVRKAVPKAQTVAKYGGLLFTLAPDEKEGQFCGVFAYERHVQLSFSHGAKLDDPANILQGSGKVRRHINIANSNEIDKTALTRLLKAASKHQA